MAKLELFGTARCPHTQEMREWLEWKRSDFVEYDVEADPEARRRMSGLAPGQRSVPVLVEDGKVVQIGWQGHSCMVDRGIIMASACSIRVRGVVQGVGFRPFVYRLARANTLAGWVLNGEEGVEIYLEGTELGLQAFAHDLKTQPPPAASIAEIEIHSAQPAGLNEFTIRESQRREHPTVRISPDLPVCDACLKELFDPADPRYWYPYINCTNCGPRYTVVLSLPYDRPNTTMQQLAAGRDTATRNIAIQTTAAFMRSRWRAPAADRAIRCATGEHVVHESEASIRKAAQLLKGGSILAVKGLGGYHLACDARMPHAVGGFARAQVPQRKTFCAHGKRPGSGAQSGRAFSGSRTAADVYCAADCPCAGQSGNTATACCARK